MKILTSQEEKGGVKSSQGGTVNVTIPPHINRGGKKANQTKQKKLTVKGKNGCSFPPAQKEQDGNKRWLTRKQEKVRSGGSGRGGKQHEFGDRSSRRTNRGGGLKSNLSCEGRVQHRATNDGGERRYVLKKGPKRRREWLVKKKA